MKTNFYPTAFSSASLKLFCKRRPIVTPDSLSFNTFAECSNATIGDALGAIGFFLPKAAEYAKGAKVTFHCHGDKTPVSDNLVMTCADGLFGPVVAAQCKKRKLAAARRICVFITAMRLRPW